jgi:hypothetical protein
LSGGCMPPVKVFSFISVDQLCVPQSGRMWFVCNGRQLGAAIRISHVKIQDAFGRTFGNRLDRLGIMLVNNFSEEVLYLIGVRNCFFADVATDTTDLAVLANQGTFVIAVTKDVHTGRIGCHANDITRANGNTFATTGTLFTTDDCQTISSHFDGIKGADSLTGAEAQTTTRAGFRAISNALCRCAVFQPQVTVLELRLAVITLTANHSDLPGCCRGIDTKDMGQFRHDIGATWRTLVQINSAGHQSFGITGATREATGTTIGPGQNLKDCKLTWINLDGKLFSGKAKRNGGNHADASKAQYRCEHKSTIIL